MIPTNAEIIFWLVALALAVIFVIVGLYIAKKQSKDYVESWRDDDAY